jgi:hypothetical protein
LPPSQLCMDEDATTNRTTWSFVDFEGPLEKFPCTNPWIEHGLMEKMRVSSACGRRRSQRYGGNAETTLARIARKWSLNVQIAHSARFWQSMSGETRRSFAFHLKVIASHRAGLVVKNLEVHQDTPFFQACHNGSVGCNSMAVTFGLERLLEDDCHLRERRS